MAKKLVEHKGKFQRLDTTELHTVQRDMTEDQKTKHTKKLVKLMGAYPDEEEKAKAEKKLISDGLKAQKETIEKMAREIDNESFEEEVECLMEANYGAQVVRLLDPKTKEVVHERGLQDDDAQTSLKLSERIDD